jgi:predicted RNA binding protein YcfA (HicA-like mRNA interferase family)
MTYKDLTRKLKILGCHEIPRRGGGSHRKWMNPSCGRATTVPEWGSRDLKEGTIKAILRQLGIDRDAFERA